MNLQRDGIANKETNLAAAPRFTDQVGLLAGGGRFPFYFANACRQRGIRVVCVGIRGHADTDLRYAVDRFFWNGLGHLGRMIRRFRKENIRVVVMAGKIQKSAMFSPRRLLSLFPDPRMLRAFFGRNRGDNRDDSLLLMFTNEMRKDGLELASALEVCPELLVNAGTLTSRGPTASERRDVAFGWRIAKEMGHLDVGQSVAVKETAVLAVEAIEGTDQMILRGGSLCPAGGFVVVKVAKPDQDMRFDVPTIGVGTIESMRRAGASALAVEAGKTILIDAEQTIALANRLGIALVALTGVDALGQDDRPAAA